MARGESPKLGQAAGASLNRMVMDAATRHRAGHLDAAADAYEQVLAVRPRHPDALHLLGLVAHQKGDHERAVHLIRRAISVNKRDPSYYGNLGAALLALARPDDAILASRRALAINPHYAEAHNNLGNALMEKSQPENAEACYRRAIAARPDWPVPHNNLGSTLRRLGNLGAAEGAYRAALDRSPTYAGALSNLGRVLHEQARYEEALECFDRALTVDPNHVDAHANRGILLLTLGRFAEGWPEYEWRLRIAGRDGVRRESAPLWDGSDLNGETILLRAEQGIGSAIQFVRYAPLVAACGGRVVLECRRPLYRLFGNLMHRGQAWTCERVIVGETPPPHAVTAPLMSLPNLMNTDAASIPADVPYLAADPELVELWRVRLSLPGDRPAIGLVWSGNPHHENDRNRSMPAEHFVPLLGGVRAHFVSLQIGAREQDLDRAAPGRVQSIADGNLDFADTAAILSLVDGVVSVDTAVAHLAGALGRRCWLLLPFVPEWRWQCGRSDSPWYPSLVLVRQLRPGDWPDVIGRVGEMLSAYFAAGRPR